MPLATRFDSRRTISFFSHASMAAATSCSLPAKKWSAPSTITEPSSVPGASQRALRPCARTEFIVSTLNDELWFCPSAQVAQVGLFTGIPRPISL